jgi:hypothetical protein
MNRLKVARQNKARQILESKAYGEKNYRGDEPFGYKLFDTIIYPSIFRLH